MRRGAAVLSVACALPVLLASPARADGELGFSHDGTDWQERLSDPLFDSALRWVPGDVRTALFYVRNQATDTGAMTLDVVRVRRTALVDSGFLHITARAAGGAWTSVEDGDVGRLIDDALVDSGRPVPVEVRVTMDTDAPNGTMVLSTDLDFRVTLRDALAVSPGGATNPDDPGAPRGPVVSSGGILPATGSSVSPWLPPLALGLLGAGTWLVVRRREDDRPDEPLVT